MDSDKAGSGRIKNRMSVLIEKRVDGDVDVDDVPEIFELSVPQRPNPPKLEEKLSWRSSGSRREKDKAKPGKLEKHLKALDDIIDKELNRYHKRAIVPTKLKDVAQLLMPKSKPPLELATVSWFGDWRPTAILGLVRSLALSSSLPDSASIDRALTQLIHEIRNEEAVIDEEMTEIQANCILHIPFSPVHKSEPSPRILSSIQSEFKKINRLIVKAQNLRFKALELVVNKVMGQTDAAEFLVAYAKIQDNIHQFCVKQNMKTGPVYVQIGPVLGVPLPKGRNIKP